MQAIVNVKLQGPAGASTDSVTLTDCDREFCETLDGFETRREFARKFGHYCDDTARRLARGRFVVTVELWYDKMGENPEGPDLIIEKTMTC